MNAVPLGDVLEAAAFALVSGRCRQAYLHDLRGGLQAIHASLELLARSAKIPGENPAVLEKGFALARRAMDGHEKSLTEVMHQITPRQESGISINLGELVGELLRFLTHEASNKSVTFRADVRPDVVVVAQTHRCRLLLLGLCVVTLDGLPPGAVIDVKVGRAQAHALIEFKSDLPCPAIRNPQDLWHTVQVSLSPYELLLALAWRWVDANGGRIETALESGTRNVLRIHYPMA